MNTTTADARSGTSANQPGTGQLRRPGEERMLAGVAGGLARCLNADVTLVRVIIAALARMWLTTPDLGRAGDRSLQGEMTLGLAQPRQQLQPHRVRRRPQRTDQFRIRHCDSLRHEPRA
jgi:phage shock protein PspC (stress-responsive transcriptional regulator)